MSATIIVETSKTIRTHKVFDYGVSIPRRFYRYMCEMCAKQQHATRRHESCWSRGGIGEGMWVHIGRAHLACNYCALTVHYESCAFLLTSCVTWAPGWGEVEVQQHHPRSHALWSQILLPCCRCPGKLFGTAVVWKQMEGLRGALLCGHPSLRPC